MQNWVNIENANTGESSSGPGSSNQEFLLEFEASKKILNQLNGNLALVDKHKSNDGTTYEINLPALTPDQEDDVSSLQPSSMLEDQSRQ